MKAVIFGFALCWATQLVAQDTTQHWSGGVVMGVDACYRSLSATSDLEESQSVYDSLEQNVLGQTFGIRLGYALNSRLCLQSGVHFISRGYRVDSLPEASIASMQFRYRMMEVPVMLRFTGVSGAIRPVVRVGCSFTYLLSDKTTYDRVGVNATYLLANNSDLRSIGLNVNAALGAAFTLTNRWTLDALLCGNQAVLSLVDAPLQRRLNSAGIWLEITRNF